eukprot:358091-Chlamydomonas_euryale.AAC.4
MGEASSSSHSGRYGQGVGVVPGEAGVQAAAVGSHQATTARVRVPSTTPTRPTQPPTLIALERPGSAAGDAGGGFQRALGATSASAGLPSEHPRCELPAAALEPRPGAQDSSADRSASVAPGAGGSKPAAICAEGAARKPRGHTLGRARKPALRRRNGL